MGCRKRIFDVLPMSSLGKYFVCFFLLLSLQGVYCLSEFATCLESLPFPQILI